MPDVEHRTLPWWGLTPLSTGAGVLLALAFPGTSVWGTVFFAVALFGGIILATRSWGAAIVQGFFLGLGFHGIALWWQTMIAWYSYAALVLAMSGFTVLLALGLFVVRHHRFAPVVSAGLWSTMETVQSVWPFGGFAWNRLGATVIDTPLVAWYAVVGVGTVTFFIALLSYLALWTVLVRTRRMVVASFVTVTLLALGSWGCSFCGPPPGESHVDVGWVQGGAPGGGVYGLGKPGTTTLNHAAETARLADRIEAGEQRRPAVVVWPENGTDSDPIVDDWAGSILDRSVARVNAPILVTVPTLGPGENQRRTTALYWTKNGVQGRYDKRNLVPFGEWIPFRDVLLPLIPMLEYVGPQAVPGETPGVISVTGADRQTTKFGVAICYEVAFPRTLYDSVNAGAEVMVVQSSNAMYQESAQIQQQFLITRVRAAELRRPILVVTTSGVSGLINDDGSVNFRAPDSTAASGVISMEHITHRTPVVQGGWVVEWMVTFTTILLMAAGIVSQVRAHRRQYPHDNNRK